MQIKLKMSCSKIYILTIARLILSTSGDNQLKIAKGSTSHRDILSGQTASQALQINFLVRRNTIMKESKTRTGVHLN